MLEYNDDFGAYILDFEDVIICWEEEPDKNYEEIAYDIKKAYIRNINHIAEAIYAEIRDIFDIKNVDEVISKLGKPQIYPDIGQVVYCENSFDYSHIISFEYFDNEFKEIEYISIDG